MCRGRIRGGVRAGQWAWCSEWLASFLCGVVYCWPGLHGCLSWKEAAGDWEHTSSSCVGEVDRSRTLYLRWVAAASTWWHCIYMQFLCFGVRLCFGFFFLMLLHWLFSYCSKRMRIEGWAEQYSTDYSNHSDGTCKVAVKCNGKLTTLFTVCKIKYPVGVLFVCFLKTPVRFSLFVICDY